MFADNFYVVESTISYFDSIMVNGKMYSEAISILGYNRNRIFVEVKIAKGYGIIELTQMDSVIWNIVLD